MNASPMALRLSSNVRDDGGGSLNSQQCAVAVLSLQTGHIFGCQASSHVVVIAIVIMFFLLPSFLLLPYKLLKHTVLS
jgi:hypothetical protein